MVSVRLLRTPHEYEDRIRALLAAGDDAFVPPLTASERATVSQSGDGDEGPTDIDGYVDRCLSRPMIAAFEGDRLCGFMSFDRLTNSDVLDAYTPTNYIAVLLIDEAYRNNGIATQLYDVLLNSLPSDLQAPSLSTKTWSTNHAHIAILERLSFTCVSRIADDRAPGIDTVYYARKL